MFDNILEKSMNPEVVDISDLEKSEQGEEEEEEETPVKKPAPAKRKLGPKPAKRKIESSESEVSPVKKKVILRLFLFSKNYVSFF